MAFKPGLALFVVALDLDLTLRSAFCKKPCISINLSIYLDILWNNDLKLFKTIVPKASFQIIVKHLLKFDSLDLCDKSTMSSA
jgi:hypothetical protein